MGIGFFFVLILLKFFPGKQLQPGRYDISHVIYSS